MKMIRLFLLLSVAALPFETAKAEDAVPIDVLFYHLQLSPAIDRPWLEASTTIRFRAVSARDTLVIQLDTHLKVDSITGRACRFEQKGTDSLCIYFNQALKYNDKVDLTVHYHGAPHLANSIKGMRWESHGDNVPIIATLSTPFLAHLWFPCIDGPADKADSVWVDITLPFASFNEQPLIGVSNGLLHHTSAPRTGFTTFHWRHGYPIVPYYVMMAVSNYREMKQDYTDPFGNSFPLIHYVFPENYGEALRGTHNLPQVMDFFSQRFGPYPFHKEKYGMTELGFYSGIENQTNAIVNNLAEGDFSTQVHELAHMWFADNLTCATWHEAWLNESFATYAEALWAEHKGGTASYWRVMHEHAEFETEPVYLEDISDPFNIFVSRVYYKGNWILHSLRQHMGDENFFKALHEYATSPRLQGGHVKTTDFNAICSKHHGKDLGWFFSEYASAEGIPCYIAEWEPDKKDLITVNFIMLGGAPAQTFSDPVKVSVQNLPEVPQTLEVSTFSVPHHLPMVPAFVPPAVDIEESRIRLAFTVNRFEKWVEAGKPLFTLTEMDRGEWWLENQSGVSAHATIEAFEPPYGKKGKLIYKGKLSGESDLPVFSTENAGLVCVRIRMQDLEMWVCQLSRH